ncbi:MAG: DUF1015 domain-containing protein [Chloroflexi bacterium HGW-Chloroflexi-6]|nr:MAG: DUF1015 domain-containing protein [Chloroflexi bacterium HGW-Chloroflexi-6]
MKIFEDIGILIPEVLLPKKDVDLHKWAVIAVDQFTSQPEYWEQVEAIIGDAPSTFHITLPEIYLEKPGEAEHIQSIQKTMREYLDAGILEPREGLIYVERTAAGKTRKGLVMCLDLEHYDYTKGSTSLIRATEGTIVDRLPPRMKIRTGAPLELPHILVLIDDPHKTVIEPVGAASGKLEKLYDIDLMLDSGHLVGYAVNDSALEAGVIEALRGLAKPEVFAAKYGVGSDKPVLLFAMGDGNHSLATAKAVWERMKPEVGMHHPARYALIELENVHDEGLEFEPIHRVLFGLKTDIYAALESAFGADYSYTPVENAEEMARRVNAGDPTRQLMGFVGGGKGFGVVAIANPSTNLSVGTIQTFVDPFLKAGNAEKIDYVHGQDVTVRLGQQPGNVGIYVPGMQKGELFKTVILDGALPRKTFSMGEAREKRFYMEARKIQ